MPQDKPSPESCLAVSRFCLDVTLDRFEGSKLLVSQLIGIFLADGPRIINQLKRAVAHQRVDDALRHVHHLKTLAGNFSDNASVGLAEKLERQLQLSGDAKASEALILDLEDAVRVLLDALSEAKQRLGSDLARD